MKAGGIASGVVLFLLGVMVILRTVSKDDAGQNLVDRVLSLGGGAPSLVDASGRPNTAAIAAATGNPDLGKILGQPPSVNRRRARKGASAPPNRAAQAGGY